MEPRNKRLDRYILNQSNKQQPKICFLPTASGDSEDYIQRFYKCFDQMDCIPTHISLFKPNFSNLESHLLSQDIIFVGGGSTRNALVLWKEWNIDNILRLAYKNGVILSGLSAGSICWFEQGITDPQNQPLYTLKCLGILPGSHCPHYDGETKRRPSYIKLIKSKKSKPGYAIDDGAAVHFINEEIQLAISSRKKAKAYWVDINNEMEIKTHYLSTDGTVN